MLSFSLHPTLSPPFLFPFSISFPSLLLFFPFFISYWLNFFPNFSPSPFLFSFSLKLKGMCQQRHERHAETPHLSVSVCMRVCVRSKAPRGKKRDESFGPLSRLNHSDPHNFSNGSEGEIEEEDKLES